MEHTASANKFRPVNRILRKHADPVGCTAMPSEAEMAGESREHTAAENDAKPDKAAAPVVTRSGYALLSGELLPALASPTAQAFAVRQDGASEGQLFALVFESLLPRIRVLRSLAVNQPHGVLRVLDCSVVDWPPLGRRAIVAVCEVPEGGRVALGDERLSVQETVQRVIWPVTRALRHLASLGIAHRSIRADNLFWADARRSSVILGECFSAPPGSDQSVAHETRPNGAADPMGRAEGSASEDLYALGITVLELTCRGSAWKDVPGKVLTQRRLDFGSASAVLSAEAPPPELMPMLRGLLNDDEEQRWGLDEVETWLRQERIPHHAAAGAGTQGKSLRIGQEHYRTRPSAAAAIVGNPRAGLAIVRSGALADWLRNGLRDAGAAQAVDTLVRSAQRFAATGPDSDAIMAARVAKVIDPDGPLRYGSVTVMPDGFGTFLASILIDDRNRTDLIGIIRSGLLSDAYGVAWASAGSSRGDALQFATQAGFGAGLERCAYELVPDLPCLSPAMRSAYVLDLPMFLRQLEHLARTADFRNSPLDAHGAAFIAHRMSLGRQRIANLGSRQPLAGERAVLELRLLAAAQIMAGREPLPLLSNWMAARIAPLPARLHNRALRKQIAGRLAAARESGQLIELLAPLDAQSTWDEDRQGFDRARHLFAAAGAEMARLRAEADVMERRAANRGREIAVAVSSFAGFSVVVLVLALQAL